MFRNSQLDRIEKKLDFLRKFLGEVHTDVLLNKAVASVSPAKAPKKRGRPAKRPEYDPEFFEKEVLKPAKRKYVRSGKYAKITTKKK